MPLIWQIPESYPNSAIGEYVKDLSPDRFLFRSGRPLVDIQPPTIRFNIKADRLRRFDCLAHTAMIPLISERVAAILLRICPGDIQLFAARVHTIDQQLTGYSLVHAAREVAAVNYADSLPIFIPGTDAVMKFNRLRHLPGVFDGIHVARERDYRSHLLVSEQLADELIGSGVTGVSFIKSEDVHP